MEDKAKVSRMPSLGSVIVRTKQEQKAKPSKRELSKDEIKETFSLFDKDGDGTISLDELAAVMKSLGQTPSQRELQAMMEEVDTDKNGFIDCDEFVQLMERQILPEVDTALMQWFKFFDKGRGFIQAPEFREVMTKLGDKFTHEEIDEMMRDAGVKGNDKITFEQFKRMLLVE